MLNQEAPWSWKCIYIYRCCEANIVSGWTKTFLLHNDSFEMCLPFLSDAGDHLLAEQCPQGLSDTGVPVSSTKATGYNVWLGIGRGQRTRTGQVLDSTLAFLVSGYLVANVPRSFNYRRPRPTWHTEPEMQNCDQTVTKLVISEISCWVCQVLDLIWT
jgi:hypothetical protein